MSYYLNFELPDGSTVTLESDAPAGDELIQAGRSAGEVVEQARQTFEDAAESARKAALVILQKVRQDLHQQPDEVKITFGLKASAQLGSLIVAQVGAEASYSVELTWKKTTEPK